MRMTINALPFLGFTLFYLADETLASAATSLPIQSIETNTNRIFNPEHGISSFNKISNQSWYIGRIHSGAARYHRYYLWHCPQKSFGGFRLFLHTVGMVIHP